MKNTFKRIISMVLVCMMLVGTLAGISVSAETAAPTVEIVSKNLAYGETIKLMYAVKAENVPEGATVTVTLTDKDNNTYEAVADGTVEIDGVTYLKFVSERGVPAQNIDAQFTATAAISGTEATDVETYSVLQYLWERLYVSTNVIDAQKAMYNALLAYAKAADVVLNGSDSISGLTYVVFNGVGEMYNVGDEIELIDDSLVAGDGEEIVWTVNGAKYTEATYVVTNEFVDIKGEVVEIAAVEMTIPEALEAAVGTKVIVTGTIISVDTAYNEEYDNITVTIAPALEDTSASLKCYRLNGNFEKGDIITVTGVLADHNGVNQIAAGATAEKIGHEEVAGPTEMTIADALAASQGTDVVVTGTVVGIYEPWSSYNNMSVYIQDANGDQILVFRTPNQVELGNIITVAGSVTVYNGVNQIAQGSAVTVVGEHVCADWYEDATCTAPQTCKLCGATTGEALGHTDENTDGTCDVCGMSTSATSTTTTTYNFSNYPKGTQYNPETLELDENVSVSTNNGCHFNTQLRIYDSSSNDGVAIVQANTIITDVSFNMGYKKATLNVYGSVDGETWVLIEAVVTTSTSYGDYEVSVDFAAAGYTYLKLDASGAQLRIASITLTTVDAE